MHLSTASGRRPDLPLMALAPMSALGDGGELPMEATSDTTYRRGLTPLGAAGPAMLVEADTAIATLVR
jgi:hypothetical protein